VHLAMFLIIPDGMSALKPARVPPFSRCAMAEMTKFL
jgi:hypothetical protein